MMKFVFNGIREPFGLTVIGGLVFRIKIRLTANILPAKYLAKDHPPTPSQPMFSPILYPCELQGNISRQAVLRAIARTRHY